MNGLLRAGDWGTIAAGGGACVAAFALLWQTAPVDRAQISAGGKPFAEFKLAAGTPARRVVVPGPLGDTVIEIDGLRARVASDPGRRQICVQQGWLSRAGATALCAPNQVVLQLTGEAGGHDSLHY